MQKIKTENTVEEIRAGIKKIKDIVAPTMGARGKNVIINDQFGTKIINDGVTIAGAINSTDPGVRLAQSVAEKTNREVGDGTTTSIVLLNAFLDEYIKLEEKATNKRKLRNQIKKDLKRLIKALKDEAKEVRSNDIENVAYISSLDRNMAETIAKVIQEIGKEGIVTIETSNTDETTYELVNGIKITEGFASPFFITDKISQKAVFNNVATVVSKKRIGTISDILPLLNELTQKQINELVIFCEEITDEVLTFLVANKAQGKFNSLVVQTRELENIAIASGATIITDEGGEKYEIATTGYLKKVEADRYYTKVLISEEQDIQKEIHILKERLKKTKDDQEKKELSKNIATLRNKVAVIKVGGETQEEITENKLKMEDALNATKSAMEEGVIEGGGLALALTAERLFSSSDSLSAIILKRVAIAPIKQILTNAEINWDNVDVRVFIKGQGCDLNSDEIKYISYDDEGIIDPVKVTTTALKNAIITGTSILTTQGIITNED